MKLRLFAIGSAAALAMPAIPAAAQSGLEDDEELIVVTGTRSSAAIENLPISVSVVDTAELARQLDFSSNILRAVEFAVPGLSPQGEGRLGCSVNIRGRETSIQINGVPVNQDLRASNCNAMFQISPFAIERVEVVRGGTALYGAGAPGGIINFITRRAKGEALEVDVVAQTSFNTSDWDKSFTTDLYAGAGQDFGGLDYYVGAAYSDAGARRTPEGGFAPFRTYESLALNGAVGADVAGGEIRFTGTWYREEPDQEYASDGTQRFGQRFGNVIPIASHPQIGEASDRLTTLALSYAHPDVLGQELAVSGFYQDQYYRQRDNFFDVNFGGDFFFASNTENERIGVRSTLVKRFDLGAAELVGSYGFDYTRNRFYRPTVNPAAAGAIDGFISPEVILNTYALFGQAEADFGRLRLAGGIRQEWYRGKVGNEGFDPALPNAATPGDLGKSDLALFNLGAIYDISPAVQLYGGFSQGAELSELGRAARGVDTPFLITPEPATSDQYELGLRGRTGSLRFELAGFYSESDSAALLQADPSCAGQTLCPLIPLRVPQEFYGFEASADWAVTPRLDTRAVVTWQRGEAFNEDLGEFVEYSTDIIAPFRVTGGATWRPTEPLRLTLQGTYYGAADYFTPGEQALGRVATESQFLLDGSIHYALGPGELFAAASNLLDEKYVNVQNQGFGFDFFYYLAEGRRVTVGYKARF